MSESLPLSSLGDIHFFASSALKSRYVITPADLQDCIVTTHTTDWKGMSALETDCGPVVDIHLDAQQKEI
jgi:hypothetical protein